MIYKNVHLSAALLTACIATPVQAQGILGQIIGQVGVIVNPCINPRIGKCGDVKADIEKMKKAAEEAARKAAAAKVKDALTVRPAPGNSPVVPLNHADVSEGEISMIVPEIVVHKPPMQFLEGRSVKVVADLRVPFSGHAQLTARLEQALREGYSVEPGNPDLTFTYTVVSFLLPKPQVTTRVEERLVTLANGNVDYRAVPVRYWTATGSFNVDVVVRNREGVTLGTHKVNREFRKVVEISENNRARVKAGPMPTDAELLQQMLTECAEDVAEEFVKTTRRIPAEVSKDRPLRPGVEFARVGQWGKAIESWKAANTSDEADRALNLGAGYEALAYQAYGSGGSVKEALPLLNEATKYYEQFLATKHEWFGDRTKVLRTRLARTTENFKRALEREEFTKRRLAREADTHRPAPAATVVTRVPESGPAITEAEFRQALRNRFRVQAPSVQDRAAAEREGVELAGLTKAAAALVVTQESGRAAAYEFGKDSYGRFLMGAMVDGKVDAVERDTLHRIADKWHLDSADTAAIEAAKVKGRNQGGIAKR